MGLEHDIEAALADGELTAQRGMLLRQVARGAEAGAAYFTALREHGVPEAIAGALTSNWAFQYWQVVWTVAPGAHPPQQPHQQPEG